MMKKFQSKKFTMAIMVFGLLVTMIVFSFVLTGDPGVNAIKTNQFSNIAQSIGLVLAGGLVSYFVGQSYIDGRKVYQNIESENEGDGNVK